MSADFKALHQLYRAELLERTIPFWLKYGIDWQSGGICTCISDEGQVQSGDKYVWSQLRAIWTFSALYNKIERKPEYLDAATHIFDFITLYGRNDRGEWYFCLDQNGQPLFDGATSIYCDGFAIYGFTEFARATSNLHAIDLARQTYANVQLRLAQPGSYQTQPLPIPGGTKAHGISMIFASAFGELGDYLNDRATTAAASPARSWPSCRTSSAGSSSRTCAGSSVPIRASSSRCAPWELRGSETRSAAGRATGSAAGASWKKGSP